MAIALILATLVTAALARGLPPIPPPPKVVQNIVTNLADIVKSESEIKFTFSVISDRDKLSKVKESKKDQWFSTLREGSITIQENKIDPTKSTATLAWDDTKTQTLKSGYSYSGRGMELSTLNVYNGKLRTCDDVTGIVFSLVENESKKLEPLPWVILGEGDSTGKKGFKCEWGTIKDGDLWIGGIGRLSASSKPPTVHKFIKRITPDGKVTTIDWSKNFEKMANVLSISEPGYVTHESGSWSEKLKKWVFMPRRISKIKLSDEVDSNAGSNTILLADEDFENIQVINVGTVVPTHGFSSFKFVPGTNDQIIVALKSLEVNDKAETFITVFDLKGNVLLDETKFADDKYEGIEIL